MSFSATLGAILGPVIDFYHRLAEAYGNLGWLPKVLLAIGLTAVTSAFGVAVVVWLPADYFSHGPRVGHYHPVLRWIGILFKNAVGLVILPLGIVMALPAVPGPGLV